MNAIQPSSGTTGFNPSLGEFVLDAFSRVQVRPTSFTADHFVQARLSANLLLVSEWSNVGMPLLWQISSLQIPLIPGISSYPLPSNIIAPLDAFIRAYQTGNAQNFTPVFTADAGSQSMLVTQPGHALTNGSMVYYPVPIMASGVLIQGPNLVTSAQDANNYEITLPIPADGSNSVALPIISSTALSSLFNVNLPGHGKSGGQTFYMNVPTMVGGVLLNGGFIITAVPNLDNFTIQGPQAAISTATVTMNGGLAQTQTQQYNTSFTDYILYPISRTDYVSQPNKEGMLFRPTTFWVERLRNPILQFWNPPDNNGPYIMNLWCMT